MTWKEITHWFISKTDFMKTIVGLAVIVIYFSIVHALIVSKIPADNREPLIHVLGTFDGVFSMLVGYYFGSSKGSQQKQEIIADQAKQKI